MKRDRPPHLHVVGTDSEKIDHRPPYTTLDTIKVATAPLVDAVRFMTDSAVQAVEDGALDFGFPVGDTDTLREEVRAAIVRFSVGWIAERLAEHHARLYGDDVSGR